MNQSQKSQLSNHQYLGSEVSIKTEEGYSGSNGVQNEKINHTSSSNPNQVGKCDSQITNQQTDSIQLKLNMNAVKQEVEAGNQETGTSGSGSDSHSDSSNTTANFVELGETQLQNMYEVIYYLRTTVTGYHNTILIKEKQISEIQKDLTLTKSKVEHLTEEFAMKFKDQQNELEKFKKEKEVLIRKLETISKNAKKMQDEKNALHQAYKNLININAENSKKNKSVFDELENDKKKLKGDLQERDRNIHLKSQVIGELKQYLEESQNTLNTAITKYQNYAVTIGERNFAQKPIVNVSLNTK